MIFSVNYCSTKLCLSNLIVLVLVLALARILAHVHFVATTINVIVQYHVHHKCIIGYILYWLHRKSGFINFFFILKLRLDRGGVTWLGKLSSCAQFETWYCGPETSSILITCFSVALSFKFNNF